MKQRSLSAIGIAIAGILPAIMGGPVWAVAFTVLCILGFNEYVKMSCNISPGVPPFGYLLIPAFGVAGAWWTNETVLLGLVALAIALPLIETTLRKDLNGAFSDWALGASGILYLGVPLFAGIMLREMPGTVDAGWVSDLADKASLGWDANPRGLAWLITVILITWIADTFAYLGGRTFGKRPLSPVVSPRKTIEGFIAALVAGAITGALAIEILGLGVHWAAGIAVGLVLTVAGLFGDLSESVLKRQAGIKDSGTLIPGHGGVLDRLDAVLFNLVAGLYLAMLIDRYLL